MKIPISKPYFTDEEHRAMLRAFASGWVSQGPRVQEFEAEFAKLAGVKYAVAANSCTSAMHITLLALGVGPGDEVVVPSYTFVATANAVEYTGARPVFCDVLPGAFTIDPEDFARRVTASTRAVMPVHQFGLIADMDAVRAVAKKKGIFVIEDAACAAGARRGGIHAGAFGIAGCFSFHPRKIITTGEGGMLVTSDEQLAERARVLRSHGASVSDLERHRDGGFVLPAYDVLGFNYRMTDLQASVGLRQLDKLERVIDVRRRRAEYYTERLAGVPGVTPPAVPKDAYHPFQSYVITLDDALDRDAIGAAMEARGVATRQGTHAVHMTGYYRAKYGLSPDECPVARRLSEQTMALPLFPQLSRIEQNYVLQCLKDAIKNNRN